MKRLLGYAILALLKFELLNGNCDVVSETVASGTYYLQREKLCPGDLIFEDNFDSFDLSKWQHEKTLTGGGNGEFQYYLNNRTNSFVLNGNLHIRPTFLSDDYSEEFLYSATLDIYGGEPANWCTNPFNNGCIRTGTKSSILNPIKSAKIRRAKSFSFKYGMVVVKAKMPAGDWFWPAVWLLPKDNFYGTRISSGEIDLVESRGNKKYETYEGQSIGTDHVSSTLHWGPNHFNNQYIKTNFESNNKAGYDTDFHTYKLVWNSTGFEFYIDEDRVGVVTPPNGGFWLLGGLENSGLSNPWRAGSKMAPFDQQFYLIINLAVGGESGYFHDSLRNPGGKPWKNGSPRAMTDFWEPKHHWQPTWQMDTDKSHLILDVIKIYAV